MSLPLTLLWLGPGRADLYVNLNRKGPEGERVYSVRQRGLVVAHVLEALLEGVVFVVGEKGRQRAIREQRHNVHAFVRGTPAQDLPTGEPVRVTYNPFRGPSFTIVPTGAAVLRARFVRVCSAGVFAWL